MTSTCCRLKSFLVVGLTTHLREAPVDLLHLVLVLTSSLVEFLQQMIVGRDERPAHGEDTTHDGSLWLQHDCG